MDCNRLARSLDSYMDHDLPDADRVALEEHIPGCACCQNLLLREQRLRQRLQLSPVPQRRGFYAMALAGLQWELFRASIQDDITVFWLLHSHPLLNAH